ncbi:mRNA export factor GLE1-like [Montipora capricornis]|uniref:mRNA export factor GLE1-like n=1 Tax=Montipora capricornis TaxID=246305 RepID=UPI0035F0FFF1
MEWSEGHNLALVREVLIKEPYRFKARTTERGKVWQQIADNLNCDQTLKFQVTKKSVREHLKLLLEKYRAKTQTEHKASGVEVEDTELDKALEEIYEKWEASEQEDIILVNNKKQAEEDKKLRERMPNQACEKLGETTRRKEDAEGSVTPKPKRERKGGNDTLEFLREKANVDLLLKKEEQKIKKEEQERQAKLFEHVLTNQQQQQEQQNQILSVMQQQNQVMLGFMKKVFDI